MISIVTKYFTWNTVIRLLPITVLPAEEIQWEWHGRVQKVKNVLREKLRFCSQHYVELFCTSDFKLKISTLPSGISGGSSRGSLWYRRRDEPFRNVVTPRFYITSTNLWIFNRFNGKKTMICLTTLAIIVLTPNFLLETPSKLFFLVIVQLDVQTLSNVFIYL